MEKVLEPSALKFFNEDIPDFIFEDNGLCHKSRAVTNWIVDNNVRELEWLAQSPDLSPIKDQWALFLMLRLPNINVIPKIR